MNRKDSSFTVAETKGTPHPGHIKPVLEHLDINHAHQRAAELRQSQPDKQFAIFDETLGFTAEGMIEDETGRLVKRPTGPSL